MKILIIAHDFPPNPGGIAIFVHNLCLQLTRLGHKVTVLTIYRDNFREFDRQQPYTIYRYSRSKVLSSIKPLFKTLYLYCKNHYDLVFLGHFAASSVLGAVILRKLFGVPYIILSHGNDLQILSSSKLDYLEGKIIINNSSVILGNSRFTSNWIKRISPKSNIDTLNPGVDLEQFKPIMDIDKTKQQYNLHKYKILLTIARLVPRKNIDKVIRALPKVLEKVSDVLYVIVGDGCERGSLENLVAAKKLEKHVRFVGYVEHDLVPSLFYASDIYISPSLIETFGISLIEAAASFKPVIASKIGGIEDAVIDGETGVLVDPNNIDQIANAAIQLLTDEGFRRKLGENGRRRVEQLFSWEKVGERLDKIISEVVNNEQI